MGVPQKHTGCGRERGLCCVGGVRTRQLRGQRGPILPRMRQVPFLAFGSPSLLSKHLRGKAASHWT